MSQMESPVFEPLTNQACLNVSMVPYTEYNRDSTVEVLITAVNRILSVAVDVKLLYEVPSPWYVDIDFNNVRTTLGLSKSEFTQMRVQIAVIQEGYTDVSLQEIMYISKPCSELQTHIPHDATTGPPDWRTGNESDLGNTYARPCRTCLRTPERDMTDQVSHDNGMASDGYYDYAAAGVAISVQQAMPQYDSGVPPGVSFYDTGVLPFVPGHYIYVSLDVPGDDDTGGSSDIPGDDTGGSSDIPGDDTRGPSNTPFPLDDQSSPPASPMNDTGDHTTQSLSDDLPLQDPPQSFFYDELISDFEMDPNMTTDQTTPGNDS